MLVVFQENKVNAVHAMKKLELHEQLFKEYLLPFPHYHFHIQNYDGAGRSPTLLLILSISVVKNEFLLEKRFLKRFICR